MDAIAVVGAAEQWGRSSAAAERDAAGCQARDEAVARQREVDELTAVARAKAAAVSVAVAELVDAVGALREVEGRMSATWRQWVAWQCGLTRAETHRVCRLAERLPELPLLGAALRSGQLSEGVTDLLVGVATPENEAEVLATTEAATGTQLQTLVGDFRRLARDMAGRVHDDEHPETAPSEAWWGWDETARFRGGFDLRAELGARVEAALAGALADLRPDPADVHANRVADGELSARERATVRRVDALEVLANTYLAGAAGEVGVVPESHQVILHRRAHLDGSDPGPVESRFPTILAGAGPVDRRLAEAMACDALAITQEVIAGFPVSEPTTRRRFSTAQRRALRARDRTCRYPGCGRTSHLHAHHTRHWEDTHRTSVADGVLLCHQHHTLLHQHRHTIHLDPATGAAVVTRPDGSELRGVSPPRPHPPPGGAGAPPADRRRSGTGERLTHYARDVTVAHWWHHTKGSGARSRAAPAP